VGCLETVTTVPHEDLILCEAVIVFEALAPPASMPRLSEASLRAGQRGSDTRDRAHLAPRAHVHHAPRARRLVLGCRYGPRQLVAPVCSERRVPRGPVSRRSRDVATGMCGVWINKARGAGAEASGRVFRVNVHSQRSHVLRSQYTWRARLPPPRTPTREARRGGPCEPTVPGVKRPSGISSAASRSAGLHDTLDGARASSVRLLSFSSRACACRR